MQNINILTLGNPEGKGVFFPNGLLGAITTPYGYNKTDPANETFPSGLTQNSALLDTQVIPWHHSVLSNTAVLHVHGNRYLLIGLIEIPYWVHVSQCLSI